ncbi:unnamed protein product [Phytomonas sp. Hart1]|nr:unnamed protein product [Phytomonas sp. Hart1]|eukprot:CCW70008.1 unnamed protein product [Phytomonas sp. isolate Hart1]
MARQKNDLRLIVASDSLTQRSSAEASGSVDFSMPCVQPFNKWVSLEALTVMGIPRICTLQRLLNPEGPVDYIATAEDAKKLIV